MKTNTAKDATVKMRAEAHFPTKSVKRRMLFLSILFCVVFSASLSMGRFWVPIFEVPRILWAQVMPLDQTWSDGMQTAVLNIRLPRIAAAALIGSALSMSGCVYQGMFKNPMVSPDILASTAGAGFGAALGILWGFSSAAISASAFIFGLVAVSLVCFAASRYRNSPTLGLVLAGIMVGSLFSAATSFLKLIADTSDQLPAITYWLMGSLASMRNRDLLLLLPAVVIGTIPLFLLRWRLNVMTLGDAEATALGVNVKLLRLIVILCATLVTSASVAVCGVIGWVGLVVPHLARKTVGCDYKWLLPAAMLMGAGFLIVVDNLARTMATSEVPLGILTAFVGAPFFLHLIMHGGNRP